MSDSAIKVEGIGKKFSIGHQKSGNLRSSVIENIKSLFGRHSADTEEFWALKEISFEIKRGEAVGIIGRNGAGKSTLLKILSRITEPTTGRFEINGRVSSLLEVGTGFHGELTGRENIFLNGTILGMKRKEVKAKFDEIVSFSGVEKFLDTPVKHYSSGMKVRLAFSVAAHLEPEILIVDEVLAVGDAEFQQKCLGKMDEVSKKEGRTVLFVSHNLGAVENLCQQGLFLKSGSVSFNGEISGAILEYINTVENDLITARWKKTLTDAVSPMVINEISIQLLGEQPNLHLEIEIIVKSNFTHIPAFIAFDCMASDGTPIFQAIPSDRGYIPFSKNDQRVVCDVTLPPLIPGMYQLSIWVGPHYTETYSWEREVVSFTIKNSPIVGRTVPHQKRHGSVIPFSTIITHETIY